MAVGEVAAGEDEPLAVLGDVLGAFVVVGIDIAGEADGFAPGPVDLLRLVEVFIDMVDASGEDEGVAVDGDGREVFGDFGVDAVAEVAWFEFVAGDRVGGGVVEGEPVASLAVFAGFPAGLVEIGVGEEMFDRLARAFSNSPIPARSME